MVKTWLVVASPLGGGGGAPLLHGCLDALEESASHGEEVVAPRLPS